MNATFHKINVKRIIKEMKETYPFTINEGDETISITIENGDWKHDHCRLNYYMQKCRYTFISQTILGCSGNDDAFSSIHVYKYNGRNI